MTNQVQVYMARLTSMEVEKKYDALTEERAAEVLELCDFVLDKIKVGRNTNSFEHSEIQYLMWLSAYCDKFKIQNRLDGFIGGFVGP